MTAMNQAGSGVDLTQRPVDQASGQTPASLATVPVSKVITR
jgi:hypothetical protein